MGQQQRQRYLRSNRPRIRCIFVCCIRLRSCSVPVDQLGDVVGSLGDRSQLIVAALDELLTHAGK